MSVGEATSRELLQEYRELRDRGAPAWHRREAYNAYFRRACAEGNSPSALRIYSKDEVERFWARTVPGPDGHVYWTAGQGFRRNDGKTAKPARWAWAKAHGPIDGYTEIEVECGEKNCVNHEHMRIRPRSERRITVRDSAILGAMQVLAMRLGRTPTTDDWEESGFKPSRTAVYKRFGGTWEKVCIAAGLPPVVHVSHDVEACVAAVCAVADRVGHTALQYRHWYEQRDLLLANGWPPSPTTIVEKLGTATWAEAIELALSRRPSS